jgi:hypothetical protein
MSYDISRKSFVEMLADFGWKESDGPRPGVFAHQTVGWRCIWSVRWFAEDGLIDPSRVAPRDFESQLWELDDYAGRKLKMARTLATHINQARADNPTYIGDLASNLEPFRQSAPECAYPYGQRYGKLMVPVYAGGFPRPAWAPQT